jgi:hypothetical protein
MSLDISRLKYLIKSDLKIELLVPEVHPMIVLSNHIPWDQMSDVVIPDLYENKKMSGRKLNIRLHLGAFILQSQYKWTDRVLEDMIRFHGPTMLFCGLENSNQGLDHSQYTRFRNRISEESAKNLSTIIVQIAMSHGLLTQLLWISIQQYKKQIFAIHQIFPCLENWLKSPKRY